ncbi:MAG: hypothetical protein WBG42_11140 [Cryomorphaceae bacterium]
MRRFFLFCVFSLMVGTAFSQDLIVTTDLDSIECKVTKQDAEYVYFSYIKESEVQSVLIPIGDVKELLLGYYEVSLPIESTGERSAGSAGNRIPMERTADYTSVHISGSYVFSRRTAPISNDLPEFLQDYYSELSGGRGFQGRFHVFVSPDFAIGAQVNTFNASHGVLAEFQFDENPDSVVIGDFNTNVSLLFIGPSIMGRYYFQDPSFLINYSFSIGYLRFRQEEFIVDTDILYEGTSLGLNGDFGLEYLLAPNVAIGIGVGFGIGTVSNIDVTIDGQTESVELEEPEGLGRISFFTGLRFHL